MSHASCQKEVVVLQKEVVVLQKEVVVLQKEVVVLQKEVVVRFQPIGELAAQAVKENGKERLIGIAE
jgi:hypothetical protein